MTEKVLGFKAENKNRIKFSDSKKVFIRVPEKDLVPVVSVEWLEKELKETRKLLSGYQDSNDFHAGEISGRIEALEILVSKAKKRGKEKSEERDVKCAED